MVKRKATQNLDEWLREGELASAARRSETQTHAQVASDLSSSTTEIAGPPKVEGLSAVGPAEVEVTQDEAVSWFWSLLGQTGFELW